VRLSAYEMPRKIHDVAPRYPELAQHAGVQGMVIIEAVIAVDGSVRDARVLRSVPLLDHAALDAVKQWRYAPTRLGGVAVPVIVTVTVQFRLQR
jgi:protein TonB